MSSLFNNTKIINTVENLAEGETIIHKIHPLVKILSTIFYIVLVVSVEKYNINTLLAFFLYPIIILQIVKIPMGYIIRRIIFVLPFSAMAGISNIIFDKQIVVNIMNINISYGIISFTSIILKTILTVLSVIILVSTTPMNKIFNALIRLKVPSVITTQLMLTYKYIWLVINEGKNMYLSYVLRKGDSKGINIRHIGMFLGELLLRCFARADRIYIAMKCKGFEKNIYIVSSKEKINIIDLFYLIIMVSTLIVLRCIDVFDLIGKLLGV